MRRIVTSIAIGALLLSGCVTTTPVAVYKVGLVSVQKSNGGGRWLSFETNRNQYEDNQISTEWSVEADGFDLRLINKTAATISIDWNRLAYVDWIGASSGLLPAGLTFAERNQVIPAATVVKKQIFLSQMIPRTNIRFDQGLQIDPLLPSQIDPSGGRWKTTSYQAGDVILFGMYTMHASTTNTTDRFRLSRDVRFQPARDPVDNRWGGHNPTGHEASDQPIKPMAESRQAWEL